MKCFSFFILIWTFFFVSSEFITEPFPKNTTSKQFGLKEWTEAGSKILTDEKPPKKYEIDECFLYDEKFMREQGGHILAMQYIHVNMVSVFDELEIPYLLYAGTALGAVRQQRYIPWTADADTLLPFHVHYLLDESKNFHDAMMARGLIYFRKASSGVARVCLHKDTNLFPKSDKPYPITKDKAGFYIRSFPYMDVYSAEELKPGVFKNFVFREKKHACKSCFEFETKSIFPSAECIINGNKFTCPRDTHHMLAKMYGRNWRKPACKNWNDQKHECTKVKRKNLK
eukprot:TRINITY_DN779858_c0_g1_i1.p1 TRINITY_DN779858_c0_g1~~TRINITY_DN779858_c0_g1_i1.p1  ORF type:complete len:285 (+),score=46.33 TRINITY_DN779858_c0_g1_i1:86-940(+)